MRIWKNRSHSFSGGRVRLLSLNLVVLFALFAVLALPSVSMPTVHAATDCSQVTDIPQAECEALLALYTSTDGDNWEDNTGWNDTNTPCSWNGVTCSAGHVTGISLGFNQVSGSIPADLGNLTSLTSLDLSYNQVSGNIPPELGNLASLEVLNLEVNQVSGSLPADLGNLAALTNLNLSSNQVSGSLPPDLGNLANLESLSLSVNQVSGSIPPELGNLASLEFLFLNNNQLSGSIPPELGNLASLIRLGLSSNQVSGSIPPDLGNLTSLELLSLSSNQVSGSIPADLGNLTSLTRLNLSRSQLSGSIPPELGNLAALTSLSLNDNQLSGSIPAELGNLANLESLDLEENQVSGSIPPDLANLASLERLVLEDNQVSGSIPAELGNLANLISLDLQENQLSGSIPPELGSLANLEFLFLNNNQVSGSIPPELGNLTNLRFFFLNDNQLSGDIPVELSNLSSASLTLSNNCLNTDVTDQTLLDFLNAKDPDWAETQGECEPPAPGTITVVKETRPTAFWRRWKFTLSGDGVNERFTLIDRRNRNQHTFTELAVGSYTITEKNLPRHWQLTSMECQSDGGSSFAASSDTALTVDLASGDEVTCTFVNELETFITVSKYEDSNRNGRYDEDEPGLKGWTMTLFAQGESGWEQVNEGATNFIGIRIFRNLLPGTYLVCETPQEGWSNTEPGAAAIEYNDLICQEVDLDYTDIPLVQFGNTTAP